MSRVLLVCVVLALAGVWKTYDVVQNRDNALRECSYRAPSPLRVLPPCEPPSPLPWGISTLVVAAGALGLTGWTLRHPRPEASGRGHERVAPMERTTWEYAQVIEVRSDRPHVLSTLPEYESHEDFESNVHETIERLGANGWELVSVAAVSPVEVVHWLKRPTDSHWLHRAEGID